MRDLTNAVEMTCASHRMPYRVIAQRHSGDMAVVVLSGEVPETLRLELALALGAESVAIGWYGGLSLLKVAGVTQ